ncbi:MAG: T9SS type A sorting domain-containing protein [Chitinophagales bacterium]|nr:T9SS type A sorting domain-containing protein [Chitinophagales bacterium]
MKKNLLILAIILFSTTYSRAQAPSTTSLPEGPAVVLKTYPNPATSYITFDFQKVFDKGYIIQVYNFLGKKMYESQDLTEKTTLNLSDYSRGVYIYHLLDRNGKVINSGKFQVSK